MSEEINRMRKLAGLEEGKNDGSPEVQALMKQIVEKFPIKSYQLGVTNNYGVYFITLPITALSKAMMAGLIQILPGDSSVGIYNNYSGLSIRTPYSIK
jgi:hypothetical protein